MKILDLALKDLKRSFRSVFAVLFMFGIPLLLTGMFYLMFGGMKGEESSPLPPTMIVITNMDEGGADLSSMQDQFPEGTEIRSMGDLIVQFLQNENYSDLFTISLMEDPDLAREAVDGQEAGVAVIIPRDFTQKFFDINGEAAVEVYQDPTLTTGPAILRSVLSQFTNGLSGAKIAVRVAMAQTGSQDPVYLSTVAAEYMAASSQASDPSAIIAIKNVGEQEEIPLAKRILGPVMGAMMIFYGFYTGMATSQTLLQEDEMGTLPRLFTTPTTQTTILGGKLLAVLLTVTVQVSVLLLLGRFIFGIHWGSLASVILFAIGTILVASAFGVFVTSFTKNTKQGGIVFGGILTFTGMIGMMPIFMTGASAPPILKTISLFVPQGWSIEGLNQALQGEPIESLAISMLVMLAWATVFFVVGVLKFKKRYA